MARNDIQEQLQRAKGKAYWRTLEEYAGSEEFAERLAEEFPQFSEGLPKNVSRRRFLMLMGASLALAGVSGCSTSTPEQHILPYVRQPEGLTQGESLYFATTMPFAGYGQGLLVESYMGRPIKIEGNPQHPASLKPAFSPDHAPHGPTSSYAQASLLTLYDPDRSQAVTHLGHMDTWEQCSLALAAALHNRNDVRLRLLTGTVTSPTLSHQLNSILKRFPNAQWHAYEPVADDFARAGHHYAFGKHIATHYRFDKAKRVLTLDADPLASGPGHVRYLRDFSSRRNDKNGMNRLYAVESTPTLTGSKADHRLPLKSSQVATFARRLAAELADRLPENAALQSIGDKPDMTDFLSAWVSVLADDLVRHQGESLVVPGHRQAPFVHAVTDVINSALGNIGQTVICTTPIAVRPEAEQRDSLRRLVADMNSGQVDVLLIIGGNPVYNTPADVEFSKNLEKVPLRVHLGCFQDETSAHCHWHIPRTHYLESWGDVRAYDGTVSIIQPLIEPLYDGKSDYELLALLTAQPETTSYDIVRSYWRSIFDTNHPHHKYVRKYWRNQGLLSAFKGSFTRWWRRTIHDGVMQGTASPDVSVPVQPDWKDAPTQPASTDALEIVYQPAPTLYDGRFANNGWLQELPRPLTKLTWDNAALISPRTAVKEGFASSDDPESANGKIVRLMYEGRTLEAPLWVLPGHADNSVTVQLGYGRPRAGHVGKDVGFNAYQLRSSSAPWFDMGLSLADTGRRHNLASTQRHHLMHNRHLIWSSDVDEQDTLVADMNEHRRVPLSLYPEYAYDQRKWGMSIDLTTCIGCNACMIACQSENNIPVVGKEEVERGREMHWLRIDTYYSGDDINDPEDTFHQPVMCMHCENAPCEVVCPVEATVHSDSGLNDMVYNRCIGTRYCSNNCPYKVRRFNFFQYADLKTESLQLMHNPEVTVRERGVMEKCTYCVQRIRKGEIEAETHRRPLKDGDIVTACQSACPAGAIVFGDLNKKGSKVAEAKKSRLSYGLLEHTNTQPRSTYLAALTNQNDAILQLELPKRNG